MKTRPMSFRPGVPPKAAIPSERQRPSAEPAISDIPAEVVATVRPNDVPDHPAVEIAKTVQTPSLKIRQHMLDIPFEMRTLSMQLGADWNPVSKTFVYRGSTVPEILGYFTAQPYSWEKLKEDELNGYDVVEAKPDKLIEPRDHQGEAADAVLAAKNAGRSGFLLADDVGLGKTISTWLAILRMTDVQTVLIVCPLAVVAHWRRTIKWMGDKGKRIVVINYERCKKLFDVPSSIPSKAKPKRGKKATVRKVRTQKGIATFGEAYDFDLIVWDESHKLRNQESARSRLAGKLNASADFVMWLSATAGQNPLELGYLASIISEGTGTKAKEMSDWEAWCKDNDIGVTRGAYGAWKWRGDSDNDNERAAASDDLEKMRAMLFDGPVPIGIRRSPVDIAGWPSITRIMLPVDLEGENRELYAKAWAEFREAVGMQRSGKDSENPMVARLRFRQKASLLRTAATTDLAIDILEQGMQVAISVAFRETLTVLAEAFEKAGYVVAQIHGSMQGPEKERNRMDFQYGRATVCLYTVEEGISLHQGEFDDGSQAPRANIIHDLRWSAISMAQLEGRTHRNGCNSPCYWMLGAGTVEEDIADVVAGRMVSMSTMQGDVATANAVEELLRESVATRRPALVAA